MQADFSRDTYDPDRLYSRVVLQQGRFLLDSDFNEQTSIQLSSLRQLAEDAFGPHWGPSPDGFKATVDGDVATISTGRYYAGGLLCENPELTEPLTWKLTPFKEGQGEGRLIYLEAWERHLSAYETGDDYLTDPALGHYDSTTRARVVWRVRSKVLHKDQLTALREVVKSANSSTMDEYEVFLKLHPAQRPGKLFARAVGARGPTKPGEACGAATDAAYYGAENQLFRVEIHSGGTAPGQKGATFKWARDNASVILPIVSRKDNAAADQFSYVVRFPAGGLRSQLKKGDWVEFLDENYTLGRQPVSDPTKSGVRPLFAVQSVKKDSSGDSSGVEQWVVTVSGTSVPEVDLTAGSRPLLRRWDAAPKPVDAYLTEENFAKLCDGVEVRFDKDGDYHRGDYWLIPARTTQPFLIWPPNKSAPPRNRPRAYAPLKLQGAKEEIDLRVIPNVRNVYGDKPRYRPKKV
jgi:hypothetical protein